MGTFLVGGVPRSGTTLMRAMLDAHPDVRCGGETRVVPRLLAAAAQTFASDTESERLLEAGIDRALHDEALGAFILSIVAGHGEPAPRLCNKDPFALQFVGDLLRALPASRFVFMVRDGRAVAQSIVMRRVSIAGSSVGDGGEADYERLLSYWQSATDHMLRQCLDAGRRRCLPVYYERLVADPRRQMARVLHFLDLPWHDAVLRHELAVGQLGGVALPRSEPSSGQVRQAVYTNRVADWIDAIPAGLLGRLGSVAPLIASLGYDPEPSVGGGNITAATLLRPLLEDEAFVNSGGGSATV